MLAWYPAAFLLWLYLKTFAFTQSSNLKWRLNSSVDANPPARAPLWKEDYCSRLPKVHVLLCACQERDWSPSARPAGRRAPVFDHVPVACSASWVPPVDALINTGLRKITILQALCLAEGCGWKEDSSSGIMHGGEGPAHDDSWERWDGDPDPALGSGLFPSLQGLSTVPLSPSLAACPLLAI